MSGRARGVILLGAACIAVGLALGWVVFTAVGAALVVLVVVVLLIPLPRDADWWDVSAPYRVVRGDEAEIIVDVAVPQGSTTWVSAVDDSGAGRSWLPAGGSTASLVWSLDTSRRGLLPGGPTRLEAADPFGIRRHVLATREPSPVLVVPRIHPADAVLLGQRGVEGDGEDRAGSDQFHSLREYVVGDPMKLVHWRSSAKAGRLMVRTLVDTTVPWLMVVLDVNERAYDRAGALFADYDPDAFEQTVDTAASIAWWSCGPHQRVLLTTTAADAASAEVTAGTRESAQDWLAHVAAVPPEDCTPHRVAVLARRQGIGRAVLVTGRRTETSSGWVAAWRLSTPVTAVVGHS